MGFTGAIKNSFGLIPHFHKAKQHAFHRNSRSMATFLVDLNECITPVFFFMDAISAMEGPGPGNGYPFPLHLLLGSTNPLALDIIATKIIGYNPLQIDTNIEGLMRKNWLSSIDEIVVYGNKIDDYIRNDFQIIQKKSATRMSFNIISKYIPFLRKSERKPVFFKKRCTGCEACIQICPVQAIHINPKNPKKVILESKKCIHCFCCHEVCPNNAIEIK
jgi:ferredoxin